MVRPHDTDVGQPFRVADWLHWQLRYVARCYAQSPVTLVNRVLLRRGDGNIPAEFLARRFWNKWGWLPDDLCRTAGPTPVWIEMHSGGEVIMSRVLLRALEVERDGFVLSTESYDAFELLRRHYGSRVFLPPWDTSVPVARVLAHVRPRAIVLVQNVFHPVLLRRARRCGAKTVLINGLLSRNVTRANAFMNRARALGAYQELDAIAVQTDADAAAFEAAGVPAARIAITGDVARDLGASRLSAAERAGLRADLGFTPRDKVFVVGSTHPGERDVIVETLRLIRQMLPEARFLIAPRLAHETACFMDALTAAGFIVRRRTELLAGQFAGHDVVLLDTFGELRAMYGVGDAAYIGSTLVPLNPRRGGHNPLEPLTHGTVPLFGPNMNLWLEVVGALRRPWPAIQVDTPHALAETAVQVMSGQAPVAAIQAVGLDLVERSSGAVERTLTFLEHELKVVRRAELSPRADLSRRAD